MLKICRTRTFRRCGRACWKNNASQGRQFSNIHQEIELLLEDLEQKKAVQQATLLKRKEQEIDTFMMKVTSLLSSTQLASEKKV